jgi:hypothetical protein
MSMFICILFEVFSFVFAEFGHSNINMLGQKRADQTNTVTRSATIGSVSCMEIRNFLKIIFRLI